MISRRNKGFWIVFSACASLAGAVPAQAAENLQCVLSLRNEAVDRAIYAAYRARTLSQVLKDQYGGHISACVEQNRWSTAANESATTIFLSEIVTTGLKTDFSAHGFSVSRLTDWMDGYVGRLASEDVQKLAEAENLEDHLDVVVTTLMDVGIMNDAQLNESAINLIGQYLAGKASARFHRERFKAE